MNTPRFQDSELSMDELFLRRIENAIKANLGNRDFGIKELGKEVGMSRSQIHRKLCMLTGKSPSRFIRSQRLNTARELLRKKVGNVSEIADKTGFKSLSYFTQVFIKEFGYPPSEVIHPGHSTFSKDKKSPEVSEGRKSERTKYLQTQYILAALIVIVIMGLIGVYFTLYDNSESITIDNRRIRLAILPFRNKGSNPDRDYIDYGIREVIINNLSTFENLEVLPEDATDIYEQPDKSPQKIKEELNADYLLESEIINNDVDITIKIQLVGLNRENNIWAETFHARWSDVMGLERQITLSLAKQMQIQVMPDEIQLIEASHKTVPRAHMYFLKASEYMRYALLNEPRLQMAKALCMDAIRIDSTYAEAWMGIGVIESTIYARGINRTEEQKEKIRRAFDKAIYVADFNYSSAKLAHALYFYSVEKDYTTALDLFTDLAEKNPWHRSFCIYVANCYRRLGDFEKAAEAYKQLIKKFPEWPALLYTYGQTCQLLHRYEEAENAFNEAISLEPVFFDAIIDLSELHVVMEGDQSEARKIVKQNFLKKDPRYWYFDARIEFRDRNFDRVLELWKAAPNIWTTQGEITPKSLGMALTAFHLGKSSDSLFRESILVCNKLLEKSPNDFRIYISLGLSYAGLGEKDKAIEAGLNATRLMNVSKDALSGKPSELGLARIYIMVGEYDQAIGIIKKLFKYYVTPEILRLDPMFDPLRNNPEFQRLIAVQ